MLLNTLNAISPIDGRYRGKTKPLHAFFSEQALIKYRVQVEVEYFIALCSQPIPQLESFQHSLFEDLRSLYKHFSPEYAKAIKDIEKKTNHDVKAVEYFLKNEFDRLGIAVYKEFIHFGLTSQDVNNTAVPLSIKDAIETVVLPQIENTISTLDKMSYRFQNIPMLARTHGQAASPTRLGKEIQVFSERVKQQMSLLHQMPHAAKFGGATGNFNAHQIAYPNIDWRAFGENFVVKTLGLHHSFPTTQIEHYDHLAALCDAFSRINTILIDMNRDFWTYISMDYFKQKINDNEVGSSAMPHKVNPIDFENAEGNLGIANAVFSFLSSKLPISRLQRDLTDSTVLRNIGVPFSHMLIALASLHRGLSKLEVNETAINEDLNKNWAVVAEAIQTILRREGFPKPYEALKGLTRTNSKITKESIQKFINELDISKELKAELLQISPQNYTGI